ncbi:MAG: FixH family protein [Pseudomonadota bacterium]
MIKQTAVSGILLMAVSTGAASACSIPDGWTVMQNAREQPGQIALKLPSVPVGVGQRFSIDILVCAGGQAAAGEIRLDATMPAHKHGMNYRPEVKPVEGNTYRGSGMFFHMPGKWQISVDLVTGSESRRFVLEVPAR